METSFLAQYYENWFAHTCNIFKYWNLSVEKNIFFLLKYQHFVEILRIMYYGRVFRPKMDLKKLQCFRAIFWTNMINSVPDKKFSSWRLQTNVWVHFLDLWLSYVSNVLFCWHNNKISTKKCRWFAMKHLELNNNLHFNWHNLQKLYVINGWEVVSN